MEKFKILGAKHKNFQVLVNSFTLKVSDNKHILLCSDSLFDEVDAGKKAEPLQSLLNPLVGSQDPIIDAFLITKVDIHQISSSAQSQSSTASSAPTITSCTELPSVSIQVDNYFYFHICSPISIIFSSERIPSKSYEMIFFEA